MVCVEGWVQGARATGMVSFVTQMYTDHCNGDVENRHKLASMYP